MHRRFAGYRLFMTAGLAFGLSAMVLLPGCEMFGSGEEAQKDGQQPIKDTDETPAKAEEGFNWDIFGLFTDKVEKKTAAAIPFEAYSKLGYGLQWSSFAAVQSGQTLDGVDVLEGMVLARDTNGAFTSLAPLSGDIRWAKLVGTPLTKFLGAVKDGKQLFVVGERDVYLISAESGEPTLSGPSRGDRPLLETLGKVGATEPLTIGKTLLLGTTSGHAFAHELGRGVTGWQYLIGGAIAARPTLLNSGNVAFVTQGGKVVLLQPNSGLSSGRADVFGPITVPAAAGPGSVFVASHDQSLYAFDDVGGVLRWRVRTESALTRPPVYHGGKVFIQVPGKGLLAVDATTGRQAWTKNSVDGDVIGVRKGRLLVWNGTAATLVDPASGDVIEKVELPGLMALKVSSFIDGDIYALYSTGQIAKFNPR